MANNDYQMLLNLRGNLIALSRAQEECQNILQQEKQLYNPGSGSFYRCYLNEMEEKYLKRYKKNEKRVENKAISPYLTIWRLMWIPIILTIVVAVALLVLSKFGLDFYVNHQWKGLLGKYIMPGADQKMGFVSAIYILSFAIIVYIILVNVNNITKDKFLNTFSFLIWIPFLIAISSVIPLYIGLNFNVFWFIVGIVLSPLVCILLLVVCILRILYCLLVIGVCMLITLAPCVWFVYLMYKWRCRIKKKYAYVIPKSIEPNMEKLYSSKKYVDALEQYNYQIKKHSQEVARYEERLNSLRRVFNKYDKLKAECEDNIKKAPINSAYKNLNMVETLLYYFNYHRATTLVQAVNEYAHDTQMKMLMSKMDAQIEEIRYASKQISNQIAGIREDMSANHVALMKELEHSRIQNDKYQNEALRQLSSIRSEQAHLGEYARKIYYNY